MPDAHDKQLTETIARHFAQASVVGTDVDLGVAGVHIRCRVNGVQAAGGQQTSASLFFDPIYETDARVHHVEGAWSRGGLALSISSDGAINGVDGSGGTYSGTIFTPWTKVDVYRVDVVASHPADPWPYHYQGVATLLADGSLLLTCEGFASWLSPARYWSPRLFR